MSVRFSGVLRRSRGIVTALGNESKKINFKAAKRITITFDPFDKYAGPIRDFLYYISVPRIAETNPKCLLKTNIVCDRSEPTVVCELIPKVQDVHNLKTIKIFTKNLTLLEILQLYNKHVTAIAPVEEEVKIVATKSQKKGKRL